MKLSVNVNTLAFYFALLSKWFAGKNLTGMEKRFRIRIAIGVSALN